MIASQLNTYSNTCEKALAEVQQLIAALKRQPIRPETIQLILDQFEINFGVDLSDEKQFLEPNLALKNHPRKYTDHIGYDLEKEKLNKLALDLPDDLQTRIRSDFALFYGV